MLNRKWQGAIEEIADRNNAVSSFVYRNVWHALCVWHMLDHTLKNHSNEKAMFAAVKDKSAFAQAEIDAMLR